MSQSSNRFDSGYYITREANAYTATGEVWVVHSLDSKDRWIFEEPGEAAVLLRDFATKSK